MSRIHRLVEKAEQEGLLTWTRGGDAGPSQATAVEEPPAAPVAEPAVVTDHVVSARWPEPSQPQAPAPDGDDAEVAESEAGPGIHPLLIAATAPGSEAAEQYRLLRTRLEGRELGRRAQLMLVTSAQIGDGKTTTSANLALTMAQEFQQKVVLVDADLRRPSLAALFGVEDGPGLVDVLVGAASLEEALVAIPDQHLLLLPAGLSAVRSTELLASSMMQRVLETLRARYDRIVVDTPPVTVADTHVLARLADGLILVVRAGMTPRPAVERALNHVDRAKVLGLVLNEVDDRGAGGYGYPTVARTVGE
jgi:capsular exopolysaccharide synthesis family protein